MTELSHELSWENNCCPECGNTDLSLYGYKYGEKEFTGFIKKEGHLYWVGKNEKYNRRIYMNKAKDETFFKTVIQHYDK